MKVLHVIGPMSIGGAQTQLYGLVRAAHGSQWDATVCATAPGAMSRAFRDMGVPMLELERRGSPGLGRMRTLRGFIAQGDFDVVNSHLWQSNVHARVAVAGRSNRPATVIVEHNVEPHRSQTRRLVDRVLDRWTDGYIALTDAMETFVREVHDVPPGGLFHVPNAIDRSVFHPVDPIDRGAALVVGSMGRFDPEKGFPVLIDAVRRLIGQGASVELRIAGTGDMETELRSRAAGLPVEFVGSVQPGADAAAFLQSLDLFVLASIHREARPVVVLEALCCGVPVVATDIPGMRETVAGGAALVAPSDDAALADAILRVGHNRVEGREASILAAEAIPDFDQLAQQYADVFRSVLERRSAQ